MEPGDAADGPNGPTDPLADGADVDHPDDDGEETFKSAAYFPSLMIHRRLEELDGVQHWVRCEGIGSRAVGLPHGSIFLAFCLGGSLDGVIFLSRPSCPR